MGDVAERRSTIQLDGMTAINDRDPQAKSRTVRVRSTENVREVMEGDESAGTIAWVEGGGLSLYDSETGQTFFLDLIQIWSAFRIGLGWKPEGGWPD